MEEKPESNQGELRKKEPPQNEENTRNITPIKLLADEDDTPIADEGPTNFVPEGETLNLNKDLLNQKLATLDPLNDQDKREIDRIRLLITRLK